MKIILEFDGYEERDQARLAFDGSKLRCEIDDFDNWLRSQIKHNDKDWDEIRDQLWELVGMGD